MALWIAVAIGAAVVILLAIVIAANSTQKPTKQPPVVAMGRQKKTGAITPKVESDEPALKPLSLEHRKKIYKELYAASKRSIREAELSVGALSAEFVDTQRALEERFAKEVARNNNINLQKLTDIEMEGKKNKWPTA